MQGRQNMSNMERKGPHKSMHCKFCKPPGVVTPEKASRAQLETKTKVHLTHEAADLRVCNTYNEPGYPTIETEACICMLEGENACPKCVPDKNRPPQKKKVCKCPKGAKPDLSKYNLKAPEKKKRVDTDEEFWWEKYSREHDALAKETWAAYMAQRRKEKKLEKCKKLEEERVTASAVKSSPTWYQKLSCQQMIYVEYLSTAIRLDSDENITERTDFVLGGLGLHPRPKKNVLKKCLRYCHYNSIQFLNQLHMLIKDDDPFEEKIPKNKGPQFTWNEKLVMNALCHLEFPAFLRELMDRLPQLPRRELLPQIPYPVFPKLPKIKYENPYEEPIWQDRLNWVEKQKIDRLNRCRLHMETKRVKIPFLALVRRSSLIDARPPFLAQIEANERASRMLVKEKRKRLLRKHPISTFNSAIDVTAIAGIEASEISTTDKADTEDICVFLRDPKGHESTEGEIELEDEADYLSNKEVKLLEEPPKIEETQVDCLKTFSDFEECSEEGEREPEVDNMEFKTPPKTMSGETIASPCPPPDATPGPPASHFEKGKRELDIINKEICGFFPFVSSSAQIVKEEIPDETGGDVESNLKSVAEKLKKLAKEEDEDISKPRKKSNKKSKSKRKRRKHKKPVKKVASESPVEETENVEEEEENTEEDIIKEIDPDIEETEVSFKIKEEETEKETKRSSEESDPDPDTEDEWSSRICVSDAKEEEKPKEKCKCKKRNGKCVKRKHKRKKNSQVKPGTVTEKENLTKKSETKTGQNSSSNGKETADEENEERKEVEVYTGDVSSLVEEIVKDLAEEGFYCATYPFINMHPDVVQLILYMKGEIVNQKLRKKLHTMTRLLWSKEEGIQKFPIRDLPISKKRMDEADWNDKKWISKIGKVKTDLFYYTVAKGRAKYGADFMGTLYQTHFGTDRYLKIFYAYMPSKYKDSILRGIF